MFLTFSIYYILSVSGVLFVLMYIDKQRARNGEWRISEKTLLTLALLGGANGGLFAMYAFRHKTKHSLFVYAMPILAIAHIVIIAMIFWEQVAI